MPRQLQQEAVQRLAVALGERGEQLCFQALDDRADPNELTLSFRSEADHVPPAVVGVPLTLDQPALFE